MIVCHPLCQGMTFLNRILKRVGKSSVGAKCRSKVAGVDVVGFDNVVDDDDVVVIVDFAGSGVELALNLFMFPKRRSGAKYWFRAVRNSVCIIE